jgi:molybdate transport system ATP-binding protein
MIAIIGVSGSGKSLTLRAIAGLLTPEAGRIVLPDGTVAFDAVRGINLAPQNRNVGYLVQDLALFPHLSVRDNIGFALLQWRRDARAERVSSLVETFGLSGMEDRRPDQISGGQQQRVALARALASNPPLLLLDEPFSALDTQLRAVLRRELIALRKRLGLTAVLVTHDVAEAYAMADRIVVYDVGEVVQVGTRDEVFYRPATLEAAQLVGVRNLVPGTVIRREAQRAVVSTTWFTASIASASVTEGAAVHVAIRPEHVLVLRDEHAAHSPNDIVLSGEIFEDVAHPQAHSLAVRIEHASSTPFLLDVDVPTHPYQRLGIGVGSRTKVVLPETDVFLIA